MTTSIKTFQDLRVWQEGHKLVLMTYQQTKKFPKDGMFGLVSQLRRSAVSVTSNIAEGFGRKTSGDKTHFYRISLGSINELQNQLLISRDIGYLETTVFPKIFEQSVTVHKMLNGLMKSSGNFFRNS
jgi:four helix bundle protein